MPKVYKAPVHETDIALGVSMAVKKAFEGRKGHGGGPCTRRVMTEEQLRRFAYSAARRTLEVAEHYERKGRPKA